MPSWTRSICRSSRTTSSSRSGFCARNFGNIGMRWIRAKVTAAQIRSRPLRPLPAPRAAARPRPPPRVRAWRARDSRGCLRRGEATGRACQQLDPEILLKLRHRFGDGRLPHPKLAGGSGEGPRFDNPHERLHRGQRSILFSAGMSEIAPPNLPCRAGIGHLSCDGAARSGGLLDGADEAVEDLFKDRHRRCEIEPDELRAVRIKAFAGAKADARMIEEELEGG
jgi:hypothetical protein